MDNINEYLNERIDMTFKRNPLFENQLQWRGYILDGTIEIEGYINEYLSSYFCGTRQRKRELCEFLFFTEGVTLEVKRQIFIAIIKRDKKYIKDHPEFLPALEAITLHRNVFAHLELIHPPELKQKHQHKLVFRKFKNGEFAPKAYSIEDLKAILKNIDIARILIVKLLEEMPPLA